MFSLRILISTAFVVALLAMFEGVVEAKKKAPKTECPQLKLKRQWGGKPASALDYQVRPIPFVVIHHTVTGECSAFVQCAEILQNIQNYHQTQLDFNDIGYNFMIGNDGVVYEGTGWGVRGAHTYGYNMNGTGIAFIGNYKGEFKTVASKMPRSNTMGKELITLKASQSPHVKESENSSVL